MSRSKAQSAATMGAIVIPVALGLITWAGRATPQLIAALLFLFWSTCLWWGFESRWFRKSSSVAEKLGRSIAICVVATSIVVVFGLQIWPTPAFRILAYESHPYVEGQVRINLYYRVTWPQEGRMDLKYRLFVVPDTALNHREKTEDELWRSMRSNPEEIMTSSIISDEGTYTTLKGPRLTDEQIKNLESGNGAVYFMGEVTFPDAWGSSPRSFCALNQADPRVFPNCIHHNERN